MYEKGIGEINTITYKSSPLTKTVLSFHKLHSNCCETFRSKASDFHRIVKQTDSLLNPLTLVMDFYSELRTLHSALLNLDS